MADRFSKKSELDLEIKARGDADTALQGQVTTNTNDLNTIKNGKGQANGYAPLDATAKVPAANLPSYVDDVLEFVNLAAFPATGESGKIFVALNNDLCYRWSGSAYINIAPSPGSTDAVPEGANNKYFTEDRTRAATLTGVNAAATGTPTAADTFLSFCGKVINFMTTLSVSIANKLNTGANTGLTGANTGMLIVLPDGTIIRDANLKYDQLTRTITLGDPTHSGNLIVASNEFKLKVQENITSGNASIEFNDNQAKALRFVSTDGKEYIALRSTDNDEAVIFLQKFVVDQGIFASLNTLQLQNSTAAANTKSYLKDSLGNVLQVPFATDNVTIRFAGNFMAHNNTGSIGNTVMSGTWITILKRIAGTISVVYTNTNIEADSGTYAPTVGAESTDNSNIKFWCQCNNAAGLDWKIGKVEYYQF